MLYKSRRPKTSDDPRKYDLNLLYLDGRVKKLENLSEETEVIAVSPDAKLIALIPHPSEDPYDQRWQALAEIDPENDSIRELLQFEIPVWESSYLSRDGKKILLYTSRRDDKNENVLSNAYSIDLATGKTIELESLRNQRSPAYYENVFATTESKFIINKLSELIEYDLETGDSRTVVNLKDLEAILQKGGTAK